MTFYDKSIIYKLKHNEDYDDTNIYIGSTSNFKNRRYQHKNNCNNEKYKNYNLKVYQYIRDNGNWDNWVMIPIEQYSCNNKKELLIRERHHIDLLRPVLNKNIPTRTMKEWCEDNKEKIKQYNINNKEKILENAKEYYEDNKEKIKEYYQANKEKILEKAKENYKDNKKKFKEKNIKWYHANKEQIAEHKKQYGSEKVICDHCGCEVRKDGLNKHQKTKKCINFVKS
jgi:predicted GIY-YIG superfamily endonuclease